MAGPRSYKPQTGVRFPQLRRREPPFPRSKVVSRPLKPVTLVRFQLGELARGGRGVLECTPRCERGGAGSIPAGHPTQLGVGQWLATWPGTRSTQVRFLPPRHRFESAAEWSATGPENRGGGDEPRGSIPPLSAGPNLRDTLEGSGPAPQSHAGVTKNISGGGVFVATVICARRVKVVVLTIPGDSEPVEAVAEVRWSRPFEALDDRPAGLGLRFIDTPLAPRFWSGSCSAPASPTISDRPGRWAVATPTAIGCGQRYERRLWRFESSRGHDCSDGDVLER